MWIKSQDGRLLADCKEITLNNIHIMGWNSERNRLLGSYPSVKRAEEVMKLIQENIIDWNLLQAEALIDKEMLCKTSVFEMPKK